MSRVDLRPKISNVDEAFAYIESFTNLERVKKPREYRLDRMRFLLSRFGNPDRHDGDGLPRYVHIAGSKGKGSTAMMVASILDCAGIRTGLYLSPHVTSYRERITIAGRELADAEYVEAIREIRDGVARLAESDLDSDSLPTTFELLTLLGFLLFRRLKCEWVVLEVGIGGRLDATNVVEPDACVITPIELEHTDWLGTTIPQVAREKAGIIKPGIPVFTGPQSPEAIEVISERCTELGCRLRTLGDELSDLATVISPSGMQLGITYRNKQQYAAQMRLIGSMQAENAALATLVIQTILPEVPRESIEQGLSRAFLPGRMEIIGGPTPAYDDDRAGGEVTDTTVRSARAPTFLLDGAHTPSSTMRLRDTFRALFGDAEGVLLFGSVDGKNHAMMAEILAPVFRSIVITTPGFFKSSHPEAVFEAFRNIPTKQTTAVELVPDPTTAFRRATALASGRGANTTVVVTGSFYLVAEVRRLLLQPEGSVLQNRSSR